MGVCAMSVMKSFPRLLVKADKQIFDEHGDKIERVIKAKNATKQDLRDPEKLKELYGVPSAKTSVTAKGKAKKIPFEIELTIVDYQAVQQALRKFNAWLRKVEKFEPNGDIDIAMRTTFEYWVYFQKKLKKEKRKSGTGNHQMYADWIVNEIGSLYWELIVAKSTIDTVKKKAPTWRKVYGGYNAIFHDCCQTLLDLGSMVHLPPVVQVQMFAHHQELAKLRALTADAETLTKAAERKMKKLSPKVDITIEECNSYWNDVLPYVTASKLRTAKAAVANAAPPMFQDLIRRIGAS